MIVIKRDKTEEQFDITKIDRLFQRLSRLARKNRILM